MEHKETHSTFAPFKHRVFTVIWIATLISNIGTWMFNVTSGWLMTELSPSPLMVSMVQAATSLPIFLFALPAGALGDIFDRRKLLLSMQFALAVMLFIFAGLLWLEGTNAWTLLFFTFLTGTGTAFSMPAWQAIVPRLVPREILPQAIALNGISMNAARAVGPALGGFILAAVGAAATVALDAASYLAIVLALVWWRANANNQDTLPRERLVGAMRAGVRFSLRSVPLRNTIFRSLAFFIFASAYWALLPLIAKDLLKGGPGLYGILLTSLGAGAVSGAFTLATLRRHFNADHIAAIGTVLTAISMVLFAHVDSEIFGVIAGFSAGLAWISSVSSLSISAQTSLPDWVRARGMAIFQMMLFGAMAVGSIIWGKLAEILGLSEALTVASVLSLSGIALTWKFKLNLGEHHDHTPTGHWPDPVASFQVGHDHGPVMVTLEYRICDDDRDTFRALMREVGMMRRRDGSVYWGYFEDVEDRGRFIEMFIVESWLEHLRQHARVSNADKALQDKVNALHRGDTPPHVVHAVTPHKGVDIQKIPRKHVD